MKASPPPIPFDQPCLVALEFLSVGDILYINTCSPYPEQESEELGDEVIARRNPTTGAIENLELLFFSTRLLRSDLLTLPVTADLRVAAGHEGDGEG